MQVLVTGGAGFIGSHVVEDLVDAGHAVTVLDVAHPAAHRRRPEPSVPGVEYVWADLCDTEAVTALVRRADAVSHQGAMVGLGVDFADVVDFVTANDLGTASLLRAMHDVGFSGRLVLASSMVVYGEGGYECDRHGAVVPAPRARARLERQAWEATCPRCDTELRPLAVDETRATDPRSVYAATKLHQEHLCTAFGREHGISVIALRYHNVYGPRMPRDTPYAGVASLFRSALEAGHSPMVYEDGAQLRDFVHVHDVARANRLAVELECCWSGALNIASGRPRTVFELAQGTCSGFGDDAPEPVVVPRFRVGDVRHIFASPARARDVLGFEAAVTFERGVAELAIAPMR